jgi:hypothetical protein
MFFILFFWEKWKEKEEELGRFVKQAHNLSSVYSLGGSGRVYLSLGRSNRVVEM